MITEQDLSIEATNYQAEQMAQKEKERLELNKYCADRSIPSDCKAEAIIDFQIKWGVL
jgi:predicted acylesterase/phospholipase RssA